MKQTVCFLAILAILSACTGGKQKTGDNEPQSAETNETKAITGNFSGIDYTQFPLAYLIDGELYFHNFENNEKVKFIEEPDAIFNFTFDAEGKTMYYSVERDNTLWLKEIDISDSKATPQWVVDWNLKKDNEIANGYSNSLLYHKGELLLEHDFHIGFYSFQKFDIYSIPEHKKITGESDSDSDWQLTEKFRAEIPNDEQNEYFKTVREELYYTRNNQKVSLTDKLVISSLKTKEDARDRVEAEFNYYTFSPDETKILFKIMLGDSEETFHGPYCIANTDGSNQFILEQADQSWARRPAWLKDNRVIFTDRENNLYVANNEDNSVQKIAENVSSYLGR